MVRFVPAVVHMNVRVTMSDDRFPGSVLTFAPQDRCCISEWNNKLSKKNGVRN